MNGTVISRSDWFDQEKWPTFCFFKTYPVGPSRPTEFWTEISGNFGWMDHAPVLNVSLQTEFDLTQSY